MTGDIEEVEGDIISVCITLYEIEIRYLHASSQEEAGILIKHSAFWEFNNESWTGMKVSDMQTRIVGKNLSGLSIYSGGARFLVGSEAVEITQDGPTEYLELWWAGAGLPSRQYI